MEAHKPGVVVTPYFTDGGRHPGGSILTYRFYKQADGMTRIDCILDGFIVETQGGLEHAEAVVCANAFMQVGEKFRKQTAIWLTADYIPPQE